MEKKKAIILLIGLALLGSFVGFYSMNLLLSDVGNNFYGFREFMFFTSLPGFMCFMELAVMSIYVFRVYIHPEYRKKMLLTYSIIIAVMSLIGLVSGILTGTTFYQTFISSYPFPGYTIIGILVHAALVGLAVYTFVKAKELPDDPEKRKIGILYVLFTILLFIIVCFAFNRFGAFIWMPVYIHMATLYMTWPFYLCLTLPMVLLVFATVYFAGWIDKKNITVGIVACVLTLLGIALSVAVILIGIGNTQFISVVSPAMPIERLATMPIGTILQTVGLFLGGIYLTIKSFIGRKDK
ncbi:MAG: hypothetical protein J6Y65_04810 [Eggerthellaceae bacterium]|nr:hypothetical protein [Eggerthellaceae bacterium]